MFLNIVKYCLFLVFFSFYHLSFFLIIIYIINIFPFHFIASSIHFTFLEYTFRTRLFCLVLLYHIISCLRSLTFFIAQIFQQLPIHKKLHYVSSLKFNFILYINHFTALVLYKKVAYLVFRSFTHSFTSHKSFHRELVLYLVFQSSVSFTSHEPFHKPPSSSHEAKQPDTIRAIFKQPLQQGLHMILFTNLTYRTCITHSLIHSAQIFPHL